jgi:hypothetical protein
MVISKLFFLKKSGNFGAFFSHKNPFLKSVATFGAFFSQKILWYELHWIFSLDLSSYHKKSFHMSCIGFFLLIFLLAKWWKLPRQ